MQFVSVKLAPVTHVLYVCCPLPLRAAPFPTQPCLIIMIPLPCAPSLHITTTPPPLLLTAGAFEAVNQLAPHVYLVAGAAFRDMVRQNTSQSLVINGESGAGKTETTKKAMQFFAKLAGGTGVEDQVLEVRCS